MIYRMVITLCYDAVSRNVEGMGISPFIMFSLSALAVLPSSILLVLLQDRIGRKGMASGSLLVGGLFTAAAGIAIAYQQHNHNAILLACLTIAARFGVAISYESGSQYATELIPTCVRGQGVAAVHVAGFAASFLAPYILWLGTFFKAAPSIILGVLFFAGSFVCLLLPETLNRYVFFKFFDTMRVLNFIISHAGVFPLQSKRVKCLVRENACLISLACSITTMTTRTPSWRNTSASIRSSMRSSR